jgi:signal transduction histidine kinase
MRVGPIRKELQFDYTALSLADPGRVRFRYKLEGQEWHSVMGRRQAFYSSLSPGLYRFRVTACNNDGVWNETGASFDFIVAPEVYQTAWFRLLCLAAAIAALWSLHRIRLRYLQARLEAGYEERLRERARIGRELHDTLLQNIAGLALQLDGVSKIVTKQPESAKTRLCELRREAEQCLHEARESLWDLRSGADGPQDFCQAVRSAAEQITAGTPVQLSMAITGSQQAIPPSVQEHLLRIVLEAVRNAVRHGSPRGCRFFRAISGTHPDSGQRVRLRPVNRLPETRPLGIGYHAGAGREGGRRDRNCHLSRPGYQDRGHPAETARGRNICLICLTLLFESSWWTTIR